MSCYFIVYSFLQLCDHIDILTTKVWKFQKGVKGHFCILEEGSVKKTLNFMAPFYGWDSTASRLEPLRGGSLLFITNFPGISGTHFTDLGRMKGWVDPGAAQWFWTQNPWIRNPTSWPLGHCSIKRGEAKFSKVEGKTKMGEPRFFEKIEWGNLLRRTLDMVFKVWLVVYSSS